MCVVSCLMNGNFNIVKVDSKGRIIVPFHIRDYLGLREGTEMLVINNEKRELRILPLLENATEISVLMEDTPGALVSVMETVSKNSVDIITSLSKTLEKVRTAQWDAIVDVSKCKDIKKLENELRQIKIAKKCKIGKSII